MSIQIDGTCSNCGKEIRHVLNHACRAPAMERRAKHFDALAKALRSLGHGENSGCAVEGCVGCAALLAAAR